MNVFSGILNNYLFCSILIITSILQVLIVQFGSVAFRVIDGGLDGQMWGWSIFFGVLSLPVQQIINLIFNGAMKYKLHRNKKRAKRAARLLTASANGTHPHHE